MRLSCPRRHAAEYAAVPDFTQRRVAKDFLQIGSVRETREFGLQSHLFSDDDFVWVVAEEIEEVGIVRRGDNLDRLASFVRAFRVSQAIESVTHVAQQPRVQPVIRFFQADDGGRLRQVRDGEQGKCDERTLREIGCFDDVAALTCAEGDRAVSRLRSFKQDSIEFWNPPTQLLVERFKSLWVLIPKAVENSC